MNIAKETARSVREAIASSNRSRRSITDEIGIPYSTMNRKISGKAEFSLSELCAIAETTGSEPWELLPKTFLPRAYREKETA
ncbi:MAG: helix-turn-helix transcriptional regulator [Winkia sp. UMB750A]|uniref:helix-turn-helix domain-containing protein n=1 Tax=unclassified Winkia TaxID=2692119 RepID=UPI0025548F29|nr:MULTISPECIES: helix-turn-helix transcriptional regulator [unclassified Winkia]MDK8224190.1 helix-turn-helix transcriptional regulator [Winkia sp. UMB750B]MDK8257005.1 helix-turn-helix transcriptional regulator [Winkia sp. UMB750A]